MIVLPVHDVIFLYTIKFQLIVKRLAAKQFDPIEFPCPTEYYSRHRYEVLDIIPKGHCFLLGDNAENSLDSREYGCIPIALIQYRIVFRLVYKILFYDNSLMPAINFRLWPLRKFGWLSTHSVFDQENTSFRD